ncbi:MAG: hypothetical protein V8S22_04020, partial [Lachnospiraceae bacterium]
EDQGVLSFTEQPEEAEKNCDNLAFLYKGRLIFAESQETLRKRYGFLEASDEKLELVPRSAWWASAGRKTAAVFSWNGLLCQKSWQQSFRWKFRHLRRSWNI